MTDNRATLQSIASSYVEQFMDLALSSDGSHLTLSYGNDSSWGLAYNLYADKLLKLDLFPDSLYQTRKFCPRCSFLP